MLWALLVSYYWISDDGSQRAKPHEYTETPLRSEAGTIHVPGWDCSFDKEQPARAVVCSRLNGSGSFSVMADCSSKAADKGETITTLPWPSQHESVVTRVVISCYRE